MQVSIMYMNGVLERYSYFKGCFSGLSAEYSFVKREK